MHAKVKVMQTLKAIYEDKSNKKGIQVYYLILRLVLRAQQQQRVEVEGVSPQPTSVFGSETYFP